MSKTSRITPYDSQSSGTGSAVAGAAAACLAGAVVGGFLVAKWLMEENERDRKAVEQLKKERRQERLRSGLPSGDAVNPSNELLPITSVNLNIQDIDPLIQSAEKLGYRPEQIVQKESRTSHKPEVLLRGKTGERVAITQNAKGRLVLSTATDHQRIRAIVRQHTVDRALEHLSAKGMDVKTARLSNGEMQILARERSLSKPGGKAEIKAQVGNDGAAWVDVDKIKGNRCDEIVSELADAIGAKESGTKKKDAYYQLPGEPAKTRMKV